MVGAALVILMLLVRLVLAGDFPLPIGYGVPVVLLGLLRSRRVLWLTVLGFVILNAVKFWYLYPAAPPTVHMSVRQYDWIEGLLVDLDLVLVAALVDIWIITRNYLDAQHAEHGGKRALALVDEDHLVGGGIAIEFRLWLGRPAARHHHVGVEQQRDAAGDRVAGSGHASALEVMMAQHRLLDGLERGGASGLDPGHARSPAAPGANSR